MILPLFYTSIGEERQPTNFGFVCLVLLLFVVLISFQSIFDYPNDATFNFS